MIKQVFAFLRGGTINFHKQELILLDAVIEKLPEIEAKTLETQIKAVSLVQRHNPGRLIAAYYPKKARIPVLPYGGYEYCLAKVSYRLNNKSKTSNIVLHNGKLMTIERNVPLKTDNIERVSSVTLHPREYKPVADEIDAEEHGSNA